MKGSAVRIRASAPRKGPHLRAFLGAEARPLRRSTRPASVDPGRATRLRLCGSDRLLRAPARPWRATSAVSAASRSKAAGSSTGSAQKGHASQVGASGAAQPAHGSFSRVAQTGQTRKVSSTPARQVVQRGRAWLSHDSRASASTRRALTSLRVSGGRTSRYPSGPATGTRPSRVATPTNRRLRLRRRASRFTQYAIPSQKTARTTSVRLSARWSTGSHGAPRAPGETPALHGANVPILSAAACGVFRVEPRVTSCRGGGAPSSRPSVSAASAAQRVP